MIYPLDDFDKKIIGKLEVDGRMPYSQIAEELGISNTMVHKRVAKLIKHKIITKINPTYDEKRLGYGYGAFTGITLDKEHKTKSVIQALKKIPEVTECHYIAGSFTLYLRIFAKDHEDLKRILYDVIDNIDGVAKTESMIDLGCAFKRNIVF
ncbi:MAG: transcriptional regulator [Saprospiraceae bacterium]|nr:MAG: transcriptional regulator [Saprospiraceae bacterium]